MKDEFEVNIKGVVVEMLLTDGEKGELAQKVRFAQSKALSEGVGTRHI